MVAVFRNGITPAFAYPGPHARKEDIGVRRVHEQVVGAGFIVYIQYFFPVETAVRGFVDPTVFIAAPFIATSGYVHNIGVGGMNQDPGYGSRVFKAKVAPEIAAIGAFIHPHAG